jgi:Na+-translocating ferredoxin:NAD+ oxidoreductase RnfD subunit
MTPVHPWADAVRLAGLRRFAIAISVLNALGHTVLGFEQSWACPLVALGTAYAVELALEFVDAVANRRQPQFVGGWRPLVNFLLSAHITGLAVSMLLYANERLWPVAFATCVALGSKALIRVASAGRSRHFLNPSNFGITVTLLAFPWVGISPPYHFTENLEGLLDWLLPGLIVASGTLVNARFTHRLPLIAGWLLAFLGQGLIRNVVDGTSLLAAWAPITGLAFVLYTFYMVTDPATTPGPLRGQLVFGAAVGATYGLLLAAHVVYGLFFALTIVCAGRGVLLYGLELRPRLSWTWAFVRNAVVAREDRAR